MSLISLLDQHEERRSLAVEYLSSFDEWHLATDQLQRLKALNEKRY